MKPFHYDPLMDEPFSKQESDNDSANSPDNVVAYEEIDDSNAEKYFADCSASDRLLFSTGKVLYKTYTYFDAPGVILVIVGFLCAYCGLPNSKNELPLQPSLVIAGVLMFCIGIVLKKLISSYAVFDYEKGRIYNETFVKAHSVFKSKAILKSDIIGISVDHQKPSASIDNAGNLSGMKQSDSNHPDPNATEAAVALLLKSGAIYHFNSFSASHGAHMFCVYIAKAISKAWKIPYTETARSKKLKAKKIGNKYIFGSELVYGGSKGDFLSSALNIMLAVGLGVAGFFLIVYGVYLFKR